MNLPASTGQVAEHLGTTEPRLNDLIRRQKLHPVPPVAAGRRLWHAEHVRQAAQIVGAVDIEAARPRGEARDVT